MFNKKQKQPSLKSRLQKGRIDVASEEDMLASILRRQMWILKCLKNSNTQQMTEKDLFELVSGYFSNKITFKNNLNMALSAKRVKLMSNKGKRSYKITELGLKELKAFYDKRRQKVRSKNL